MCKRTSHLGKGITNIWTKLGQILSPTFLSRVGKGNPTSSCERASQGSSSLKIFWRKHWPWQNMCRWVLQKLFFLKETGFIWKVFTSTTVQTTFLPEDSEMVINTGSLQWQDEPLQPALEGGATWRPKHSSPAWEGLEHLLTSQESGETTTGTHTTKTSVI